jgi:hypothetical protein
MRNNISMNPSLHTRVYRDKGAPEVEGVVEPICAAVQDSICVKWCRPAYARLQPDQRSSLGPRAPVRFPPPFSKGASQGQKRWPGAGL